MLTTFLRARSFHFNTRSIILPSTSRPGSAPNPYANPDAFINGYRNQNQNQHTHPNQGGSEETRKQARASCPLGSVHLGVSFGAAAIKFWIRHCHSSRSRSNDRDALSLWPVGCHIVSCPGVTPQSTDRKTKGILDSDGHGSSYPDVNPEHLFNTYADFLCIPNQHPDDYPAE